MLKDDLLPSSLPFFPFELTFIPSFCASSSDYESNPDLDTYSQADIDDVNDFGQMSMRERREAEREMEKRDRGATGGEFPFCFLPFASPRRAELIFNFAIYRL